MPKVTARDNPRLSEAARLIASSRDRRKSGKCVLEGDHLVGVYLDRVGAPETLLVVEERATIRGSRRWSRACRRATCWSCALRCSRKPSQFAGRHRRARGRRDTRARAAVARALPSAARRPAGSGQRRHHPAHGGRRGRASRCCCRSTARSRGRRRCCARGRARISSRRSWRTSTCRRGRRRSARAGGQVVATAARDAVDLYAAKLREPWAVAIGNEGSGLTPALARRLGRARSRYRCRAARNRSTRPPPRPSCCSSSCGGADGGAERLVRDEEREK